MKKEANNIGTHTSAKHCFSYIRFSSRKQAKGDSELRQLEIAPRVAKEKGWILRDDLNAQSLGMSAYKGSNLETIRGIIKAANDGKIPRGTVMILEALDRLTRLALDEAYQLFRELLKAGIELYTDRTGRHMTEDDLNNPFSLMMTVAELDQAFQHSDKLSDRVGKAWKRKKANAAEGILLTKMTPAWLEADRETNKFAVVDDKANLVRRIFNSYANGKGIRTIMREFNKEKIKPFGKGKQNESGIWSSTHLRRLLTSRAVIGEYQPCKHVNGERIPDGDAIRYYPPIIEPSLFYKVQEMLPKVTGKKMNKAGKLVSVWNGTLGRGPKGNATNLFTGLAKCACGASMVIKQSGLQRGKYAYTSLVCYNAARGGGCKYATIQYQHVERAILTIMFSKVVPAMIESDTREDKLAALRGELKEAQKQKAKWIQLIESSETLPPEVAQKLNLWDTKEKALLRQIDALEATIHDNPLADWQHVEKSPENRLRLQALLANEIEALTIDAGTRQAILKTKRPETSFTIGWPASVGTNKTKANVADVAFFVEGHSKPFIYLDEILVWKTDKSLSYEKFIEMAKPDKDTDERYIAEYFYVGQA